MTEKSFKDMTLEELDDKEDDIDEDDERAYEEYRKQRMAEIMANQKKALFGDVHEISRDEYIDQVSYKQYILILKFIVISLRNLKLIYLLFYFKVNKAGKNIYVVLLVYKQSLALFCALIF